MNNKKFYTYSFEKLEVWQLARKLRKEVYKVTRTRPREELFGLTNQIRKSSSSICDNLSEGSGNHLDLKYIKKEKYVELRIKLDEIINKLNSLYQYQLRKEENLKERISKNNH